MTTRECLTFRVAMSSPADVSGLAALFDTGVIAPEDVVAVLGKTEGNGCVNDFSRGYASMAVRALLADRLGRQANDISHVAIVMSGGVEGGLSPHFLVFAVQQSATPCSEPALAVGVASTRAFLPEEIGRMAQVQETAAAVRRAMDQALIADAADVHFVQIKCPLLTSERIAQAESRGQRTATHDTYASMGFSRGASALGVALALGEVEAARICDQSICQDLSLWSACASASAGGEIEHCEVIVCGNSLAWTGDSVIAHGVMQDGIDSGALHRVLADVSLKPDGQLDPVARRRVKAVIAKAEPARNGRIRNARHIMWDDSDINATRHARALVGGVLAGVVGCTDLFISGGAEHQGPDGGGPVVVIASRQ